ncbi:MAG: hypothetical protein AUG44_02540 [Actinobacteria bacterium 13_1_20CM_3_71_11]|nr:MAG: hypothetical protein AUG44_02540 [Actinobacteria bacterium 13_1_20CM_3_71_11]
MSTFRLGIDFGTSHTVAVVQRPDGRVEPLLFDSSPLLISAVYAEPNGRISVGRDALHSARVEPGAYEPHPKRRIDEHSVLLGTVEYPVGTLVAAVLARVEQEATRVIGRPADQVVLTCPAGWGAQRRGVLVEAARTAGLGTPHLVPEPLGAACYFSEVLGHRVPVGGALLVYDYGAGTFDAAVVRRTPAGWDVLAVDGLTDCGGLDLDSAMVDSFRTRMGPEHAPAWARLTNPQNIADRRYRRMLWDDVRAAKEKLSRSSTAGLPVPLLDIDLHITRESFEELARPWLDRTMTTTLATLARAGVTRQELVGVLLAGGSSRIPLVATLLHQRLGLAPTVTEQPELVVAQGSLLAVAGGPAAAPVSAAPAPVSAPPQPVSAAPYPMSAPPYPISGPPQGGPGRHEPVPTGLVSDTQSFPAVPRYAEEPRWSDPGPPRLDGYAAAPARSPWVKRGLILGAVMLVGVLAAGAAAGTGLLHTLGGDEAASGSHGGGGADAPNSIGGTLPGGSGSAPPVQLPPSAVKEASFVHVATGANSSGDYTTLSNAVIDNNPNAVILVTQDWNPSSAANGVYNDHAIGVYYYSGHWAVFNQDLSAIPAGTAFNVHAWSAPTTNVLVQVGDSGSIQGDQVGIDSPGTKGRSSAFVSATANWSPPTATGTVYNNHPTGVYYTGGTWAVFNEDTQSMPDGVAFNVAVGTRGARAGFAHTASAANSSADYTDLDNPATNGHPNAVLIVTPTWGNSVYDNHNIGVWYHDGKWSIFSEDDNSPIPAQATFNVLVYGG